MFPSRPPGYGRRRFVILAAIVLAALTVALALGALLPHVLRDKRGTPDERGLRLTFVEGKTYTYRVTTGSEGILTRGNLEENVGAEAVVNMTLDVQDVTYDGTASIHLTTEPVSLIVNGHAADPEEGLDGRIQVGSDGGIDGQWGIGVPSPISQAAGIPDLGTLFPVLPEPSTEMGESWSRDVTITSGDLVLEFESRGKVLSEEDRDGTRVLDIQGALFSPFDTERIALDTYYEDLPAGATFIIGGSSHESQRTLLDAATHELIRMDTISTGTFVSRFEGFPPGEEPREPKRFQGTWSLTIELIDE